MKTIFYACYIILFLLAVAGWYIKGFGGGCLFGFAVCMLLLTSIGRKYAKKAERRMNKNMRDIIIQNE